MNQPTTSKSYGTKGFSPRDPELARQMKKLAEVSTAWGIWACLEDWLIIIAAACGSWIVFSMYGITLASLAVYALAAFIVATRLQGLRNIIHEASHFGLSRNRPLNDFLCRLTTFPVQPFLDMEDQRREHVRGHHLRFLNPTDNVFCGYVSLGIHVLPLASRKESLNVLMGGMLRYCYWHVAGTLTPKLIKQAGWRACMAIAAAIAIVAMFYPQAVLFGALMVLLYWMIPLVFVLPMISFLVLIAEHLSTSGTTEFERSRNKLGFFQRVLFHPHGDAFHMLHHLYPGIPHNRLGKAHRLLMQDPVYRNGNHYYGLFLGRRAVFWAVLDGSSVPNQKVASAPAMASNTAES